MKVCNFFKNIKWNSFKKMLKVFAKYLKVLTLEFFSVLVFFHLDSSPLQNMT